MPHSACPHPQTNTPSRSTGPAPCCPCGRYSRRRVYVRSHSAFAAAAFLGAASSACRRCLDRLGMFIPLPCGCEMRAAGAPSAGARLCVATKQNARYPLPSQVRPHRHGAYMTTRFPHGHSALAFAAAAGDRTFDAPAARAQDWSYDRFERVPGLQNGVRAVWSASPRAAGPASSFSPTRVRGTVRSGRSRTGRSRSLPSSGRSSPIGGGPGASSWIAARTA